MPTSNKGFWFRLIIEIGVPMPTGKSLVSQTPAFGVQTSTEQPPQQTITPEVQAMLAAAQNTLPPWARWIFTVAIGPLLLTTYGEVKDIWGVPQAQKAIVLKIEGQDRTIGDLVTAQKTLAENQKTMSDNIGTLTASVVNITSSVQRVSDQIYYMNFTPASQPTRNPGKNNGQ